MKFRKQILSAFLLILSTFVSFAQQEFIPLGTYFRDNYHTPLYNQADVYVNNGWYSTSRKFHDLDTIIYDYSPQYYDFTQKLFKEHLFQFYGKNYRLEIDPLFNFSMGKDFSDTASTRLYQNTRGFQVRGTLLEKVGFFTSFHENQAVFSGYQNEHYNLFGEKFLASDSMYNINNAVIPSGGRTKSFKTNGYDYGFATSYVSYMPTGKLLFTFGSMQDFVGSGYRSILLSDNSFNYSHMQYQWRVHPKFTIRSSFGRQNNLFRIPNSTTVEAMYEKKNLSVHYLTFSPSSKLNISFFEATHWLRGDSSGVQRVDGMFYVPLPILTPSVNGWESKKTQTMLGFNVGYSCFESLIVYGQFALSNFEKRALGYQVGLRLKEPLKIKQSFIQLEVNGVGDNLYLAENRRLNYTQFNLPLAHPRGGGFTEFILRTYIERKRVYLSSKSIFYDVSRNSEGILGVDMRETIAANENNLTEKGFIYHQTVELGYRFNRKTDFKVFTRFTGRASEFSSSKQTNTILEAGLKTGLFNSYSDF